MEEYITSIKELNAEKVLICVNDAPSFVLYKNEPEKFGLNTGEPLSEDKKNDIYNASLNVKKKGCLVSNK